MSYIIKELLRDKATITLFGDIDDDGRQQKTVYENVNCYISHKARIKYISEDKSVVINGSIYIEGRLGDGKIRDGKVGIDDGIYKVVGYREFRDIGSDNIVYTRLEIV